MGAIHQFLYDHHWWIVVIFAPILLISLRTVLVGLAASGGSPQTATTRAMPTPLRPSPSRPVPPPVSESPGSDVPSSVEVGVASRINRGQQKTVRLPPRPEAPRSTTELDRLDTEPLGGIAAADAAAPAEAPAAPGTHTSEIRRQASRLEELGFHHSIESTEHNAAPKVEEAVAARRLSELGLAPVEAAAESAEPSASAELDDILARLDKALGQEPDEVRAVPMASASPMASAPAATQLEPVVAANPPQAKDDPSPAPAATPPATTAPLWARADAFDEDVDAKAGEAKPRQMGLFDQDPGKKT
jgi:hypothetical protein